MKLLKKLIWCLLPVLFFCLGVFMQASELIRMDVRSGQVRTESLPLDFPPYPRHLLPNLKEPAVEDVQTNAQNIPQYQFLSEFAREELEMLENER